MSTNIVNTQVGRYQEVYLLDHLTYHYLYVLYLTRATPRSLSNSHTFSLNHMRRTQEDYQGM